MVAKLDPDMVNIYHHTENEVCMSDTTETLQKGFCKNSVAEMYIGCSWALKYHVTKAYPWVFLDNRSHDAPKFLTGVWVDLLQAPCMKEKFIPIMQESRIV